MKKEIEEIREALKSLDAYDEETGEALRSLEDALDEIDQHPALGKVQETITGTSVRMRTQEKTAESWESLKEHLDEWEDHHPGLVLSVGKMARVLAVLGL
ncbi:MAG: hypothetical protein P1U58_09210 [Verrucomicrobiales bacterium]|nr:hypothetical protein [Verrucomicrobiales bacterium]